jgi:hypothetical protein
MIQRIQTVFLLFVNAISIILLFVPFVQYEINPPLKLTLLPGQTTVALSPLYYLPVVFNFIILAFAYYVIFQFKKRQRQMKLANLLVALNGILLGLMLLFDFIPGDAAGNPPIKQYLAGSYLPIVSMALSFLAARFIKKDEELVRSADRIR